MAKKLDSKEIVSFEELLMSNVYTQDALVNLLESKGIITKAEVLEEKFCHSCFCKYCFQWDK